MSLFAGAGLMSFVFDPHGRDRTNNMTTTYGAEIVQCQATYIAPVEYTVLPAQPGVFECLECPQAGASRRVCRLIRVREPLCV